MIPEEKQDPMEELDDLFGEPNRRTEEDERMNDCYTAELTFDFTTVNDLNPSSLDINL